MIKCLLAFAALAFAAAANASTPPSFTIDDVKVAENGGSATLTIHKSAVAKSYSQVRVYTWADGTATSGVDYQPINVTVTFGNKDLVKTVSVPIIDDNLIEGDETFHVDIGAVRFAAIARGEATVTIVDNDVAPAPVPIPPPPPAQVDPPGSVNNPLVGRSPGVGAPDIPTTDHNVNNDLTPMQLAVPSAPGDPGAFRFICRHTNLAFDDPTVFYEQPGKSHLHDQTGVYGWSAYSNYGNLRTGGGGSGCNDVAGNDRNAAESGWSANRTPYWQPALLDGKGNVILADFIEVYYKRRASTDPVVSDPTNPQYEGKAAPLPNGIKYIFGAFPDNSAKAPDTQVRFQCTSGASGAGYGEGSFADMIACAKAHSDGSLTVRIEGPSCWDGVNLDSADHRSHLAYASYGDWGYQKCDAAHPYVIPTYTYAAYYTILPTDTGDIHWSSDEMDNSKPRGWSFHVDYGPAAWDPTVQAMWTNNCIEKLLSCVSGNLGNGLGLKGAAVPYYLVNGVWTALWRNPVRLVPVPAK